MVLIISLEFFNVCINKIPCLDKVLVISLGSLMASVPVQCYAVAGVAEKLSRWGHRA